MIWTTGTPSDSFPVLGQYKDSDGKTFFCVVRWDEGRWRADYEGDTIDPPLAWTEIKEG